MAGKEADAPISLLKGGILERVDRLLNEKDEHSHYTRRASFLNDLEAIDLGSDRDDNDIASEYLAVLQSDDFTVDGRHLVERDSDFPGGEERFLREWFARDDFQVQSVVRTLIQGTKDIIGEASALNLPIDSYWLGGVPTEFKLLFYTSDYQVTRVIFTPE